MAYGYKNQYHHCGTALSSHVSEVLYLFTVILTCLLIHEGQMTQTKFRTADGAGGRRCCTGLALSAVSGFNGFCCGTARSRVADKRQQKQHCEIWRRAAIKQTTILHGKHRSSSDNITVDNSTSILQTGQSDIIPETWVQVPRQNTTILFGKFYGWKLILTSAYKNLILVL